MSGTGQETQTNKPLAYRVPKSVQYYESNGSPVLILRLPLKAITIHPSWKYVFTHLSKGNFVTFENIVSLMQHADSEEIEIFLNGLVHKGFLEREGFPVLTNYPPVSIIIPVRNRPEEIASCLQSLSQLDYPEEKIEVFVIDDASDDDTPAAVSKFPVNLISTKEHKQAPFCRNLAAREATGEILAFLDSDCSADPLWFKELIHAFRDPSLGAVGGVVDAFYNEKGLDRYEEVKSSLNMGHWFKSSREGDHFFYVPSCNLLVRRILFLRLGGFRDDMYVGEDVDFCWRLQDLGYHVEYWPVGRVFHKHRNRIWQFCTRRFDYGTSEPLLQQAHEKRIKQFFLPPAETLFWVLIVLYIILKWIPLLGLCVINILIDSLFKFIRTRKKNIPIKFPRLLRATFRGYLAFYYHCCAFISRYYLILAVLILPFVPLASLIVFGMHFLTGLVEYFINKPHLNFPLFVFYFSLDQLAYQSGVWWGCLKRLYFRPVNPQLVSKIPLKE
ncbi:MAG: mycofactocin biosynthesis glycosyltransferase MftF [Desulfobacteraceae bacterium]|nr:MAG: mycofactocin biosynthesis glycosyltransferase MftF [Desulfobacteraceae bacterium]